MKKLFAIIAILSLIFIQATNVVMAQDAAAGTEEVAAATSEGGITLIKRYFIEGSWIWMTPVLLCLIFGLAFCIERIITLSLSDVNTRNLLKKIESAVSNKDVEKAKQICKATRGPVASIMYQGLSRTDEGIEIVEKSVSSYGSVQMGQLEKGLSWISLFIALAPMFGFLGTVVGMVQAFDDIASAGAISATIVAAGIKVALLTTVFGLIVAIILQVFYNFIVSKVEAIVNKMEDSSITFIDILVKNKVA
jgi:biopolymer transport protein ExbB